MAPSAIYAPLIHAKTNIRLVVLSPDNEQDHIQCHLRIVDLSHSGRYEALSYEWGSPDDAKKLVFLNGQRWFVRQNLWQALNALKSRTTYQTLWIDALCINQSDKREKNHQVPLMREIYRGAHLVRVWLGVRKHSSSEAIAFLRRLASSDNGEHWLSTRSEGSLLLLCHGRYWTRIWIVQELMLAREGIVHCGKDQISLSQCTQAQVTLGTMAKSGYARATIGEILQSPAMKLLQKRQRNNKSGIFEPLNAFRLSECSLQHDKLYDLLGLARDVSMDSCVIDYDLPLYDVMVDLVLLFLELNPHTPRSIRNLCNKAYEWMGFEFKNAKEVEDMVAEVVERMNEASGGEGWESGIKESDDDEGEMERSDNGSISSQHYVYSQGRGGLDFSSRLTHEQPSIEMECDMCGVVLTSINAFKKHRRKIHNFRGLGPQSQPRRPREGSISISSTFVSSRESSPYVRNEPPSAQRGLAAGIKTECSECGKFFPSMARFKQHRRPRHLNARASPCEGAVPVPVGKAIPASTGYEKSMSVSIRFPPSYARERAGFDVLPRATIAELKRALYDMEGIPLDPQLLIYEDNVLEERRTASECGIQDESTIYLFVRD